MNVQARQSPSRRRFFVGAAGTIALVASGCAPAPTVDRKLAFASLDDALRELDQLSRAASLKSGTAWMWPQTLVHCAQSIEYSMTGFPIARSSLFQRTAGAAAFNLFSWRGRMSHDLAEPIPGAPLMEGGFDAAAATARLRRAVADFRASKVALRPHFAYGELSRAEYEAAHAMHLANHFSAFEPVN
jgi:hypothetical protein